ncbi:MAG: [FeFe] hydrogenase H-cluster radical SAM maturase HydE [Fibrobacterota bacterium]
MSDYNDILGPLLRRKKPGYKEIAEIIQQNDSGFRGYLYAKARLLREKIFGNRVLFRGIVEFSNICRGTCRYCGLNRNSTGKSFYDMSDSEIVEAAGNVKKSGISTVVLQSGENPEADPDRLASVIKSIKKYYNIAVTLSAGEKTYEEYRLWRNAGADRYLLKMETADSEHYSMFHPGMNFHNRLRCLDDLKSIGYETGSGFIVGLPEETPEILAKGIVLMRKLELDMISISPFTPCSGTDLAEHKEPDMGLFLSVLSLMRVSDPKAHMPAVSALASGPFDKRIDAVNAGANVMMFKYTPAPYAGDYMIYNRNKHNIDSGKTAAGSAIEKLSEYHLTVDYGRGGSIKKKEARLV